MQEEKKIEYYAYFSSRERSGMTGNTPEEAIKELREETIAEQESILKEYKPGIPREEYRDYDKQILGLDAENGYVNVTAWKDVEAKDLAHFVHVDEWFENMDECMTCEDWQDSDGDYVLTNIDLSKEQEKQINDLNLFIAKRILEICQPGSDIRVPLSHKIYTIKGELVEDVKFN